MERNLGGNDLVDAVCHIEALESGERQNDGIKFARVEFLEAGVEVASNVFEGEVGIVVAELGEATEGGGADDRPCWQRIQLLISMLLMNHQSIRRIFPLGDAAQHQALWQIGGQVFEGVNREVGFAVEHSEFEFFGEESFVANFGEGHVQDFVALRTHGVDFDFAIAKVFLQFGLHPVSLDEGKLTFTRADPDRTRRTCNHV
jgi:hypothetical protein